MPHQSAQVATCGLHPRPSTSPSDAASAAVPAGISLPRTSGARRATAMHALIVSRDGTTESARFHHARLAKSWPRGADLNCARIRGPGDDSDDSASHERRVARRRAPRPGLPRVVDLMRRERGRPWPRRARTERLTRHANARVGTRCHRHTLPDSIQGVTQNVAVCCGRSKLKLRGHSTHGAEDITVT